MLEHPIWPYRSFALTSNAVRFYRFQMTFGVNRSNVSIATLPSACRKSATPRRRLAQPNPASKTPAPSVLRPATATQFPGIFQTDRQALERVALADVLLDDVPLHSAHRGRLLEWPASSCFPPRPRPSIASGPA